MQAVIMAGGKGTRLLEITKDEIPKPMVPIADKPILEWQLACLRANGITEVVMVLGHLGDCIESFFKDGAVFGMQITYYHENSPMGTAGALPEIVHSLHGDDFLLVFGDVIFDIDVARMMRFHKQHKSLATLFVHPNAHPVDSDLIIADDAGRITAFDSKNNTRDYWYSNCVNAGFYILNRGLFLDIPQGQKLDLEKQVLMPMAVEGRAIYAYSSPEYIKDVGTVERIAIAEQELNEGKVAARNLKNKQKCIFLDRDGTINVYRGLISEEDAFELEQTAVEAIRRINKAGYLAIVVTNQPVVARGMCDVVDVKEIHKKMETLLGREGVFLDDILFCPHHPDKGYPEENPVYKIPCTCRKPQTGMIDVCVDRYNIDLTRSWMVGDTTIDLQTGINAGLHTALVLTGEGGRDKKYIVEPELIVANILQAVEQIIN
ncbi:MAG: HAD-IIIA family hydrolase [Hydrogenoanaerobacterium sp.]